MSQRLPDHSIDQVVEARSMLHSCCPEAADALTTIDEEGDHDDAADIRRALDAISEAERELMQASWKLRETLQRLGW